MTTPTGQDFDTVVARNNNNVRKALKGGILLGRYPDAPIIESLNASGGQIVVPTDFTSAGWLGEDGTTFATDTEVSDVRGWGSASFIRRDIQTQERTLQFVPLETKRLTHELMQGLDLSGIEMSATGEWVYDVPDRPATMYWRALAIAVDGDGDSRYYLAKFFPRVVVSETDDQTWSDGDDPVTYPVTLSALVDDDAGFVQREFLFGPGALAAAEAMGITVAPAA